MKTRNPVFDIMKGIGILLVLIGHIPPGERLFHFIYSFHMPLFFIVAGVFSNTDKIGWGVMKKYAYRLLLPVLVTMAFIIALSPLRYFTDHSFKGVVAQLLSLFWAGDALHTRWGLVSLDSMWFLLALFWAKCLFHVLGGLVNRFFHRNQDEVLLSLSFLVSAGAVALHRIIPFVPWGMLLGLSAMVFLAAGWYMGRNQLPIYIYLSFIICWFFALRYGSIDMASYHYGFYPLDIFGALGATGLVFLLSKAIHRYAYGVGKILRWCGINSLLILCINTLDRKTYLVRAIKGVLDFHPTGLSNSLFHYSIECLLIALFVTIPFLRRVYGAKLWKDI